MSNYPPTLYFGFEDDDSEQETTRIIPDDEPDYDPDTWGLCPDCGRYLTNPDRCSYTACPYGKPWF